MRPNTPGVTWLTGFWRTRRVLTLLLVLLVALASASAFAGRGGGKGHTGGRHTGSAHSGGHHAGGHHVGGSRFRLGVILAAPAFLYYPPVPYYPAVAPSGPPVYIERNSAPAAPDLPAGYWYYCADSRAYYPYVKECAGAWQPVAPLGQ